MAMQGNILKKEGAVKMVGCEAVLVRLVVLSGVNLFKRN